MKKILSLCMLIALAVSAFATKYQILKLSSPSIVIGGKTCKKGSVFEEKDRIIWASDNQGFWARDLEKGTNNYFSALAFKGRKSTSAFEYLRTNKMSSRSIGFDLSLERSADYNIQEKRIALVIANANYHAEENLRTPIPDALAMAETLRNLGFNVYVVLDASKATMNEAVKKFCGYASNYETALIYYAGHGSQFNNDTYLMPVDAIVETSFDVEQSCVATKRIVSFLNDVKSLKTRLVLIDACRTTNKLLASRGDSDITMLNTDELREGIVLYSTKHGYVAYDQDNEAADHSPFATAIIKNIVTPNLSVGDFITDVMNDVKSITSVPPYPHPQEPRSIPTLTHRFYFNPVQKAESAILTANRGQQRDEETAGEKPNASIVANPTTPEELYEAGMAYYKQKDFKTAVGYFLKSSAGNYAPAQAILGICYLDGKGVEKDPSIAREFYEKAAKKNNPRGINGMGLLYLDGLGVTKDIKKAIKYFGKAASMGYGPASFNLANIYLHGEEKFKDGQKGIKALTAGAASGHPRSCGFLGYYLERGVYCETDSAKALEYFNKGVKLEDWFSEYYLAFRYRDGKGVPKNPERAVELFENSIEHYTDFQEAKYELGLCYKNGIGVKPNLAKAIELLRSSAELGCNEAYYELASCYDQEKDYSQAFIWYQKAAALGDAYAQNSLGCCYSEGTGVKQNYDLAVEWFKKSAAQNNLEALCNLGFCYEAGHGVPKDYKIAAKCYEDAANLGSPRGQMYLGYIYYEGIGVEKDSVKAFTLYELAASSGYAEAQRWLAICYYYGKGTNQDYKQSAIWYRKAADGGDASAQNYLAYSYYNGLGLDKNLEQAVFWWRKTAEIGNYIGQYNLGHCYENGFGVQRSIKTALEWYQKSAAQNYEEAIKAVKRLAGK